MIQLFVLFIISCFAQTKFIEKTLQSKILNQTMKYAVYFPEGYSPNQKYPILYALHGMGVDHFCFQLVEKQINEAISQKKIKPCIIVTPQAFNSFYINKYDGSFNFEKYFFDEFIPHVEETYPTQSIKSMRAILGVSMGGFGSAYYSLVKKDYFSSVVAMSPALLPENGFTFIDTISILKEKFHDLIQSFGNNEYYNQHNFNFIVRSNPKGFFKTPLYGCIGKQDFLYPFVNSASEVMKEYQMDYIWDVDEVGAHELTYWIQKMPKVLSFIEEHWTENNTIGISIVFILFCCLLFI